MEFIKFFIKNLENIKYSCLKNDNIVCPNTCQYLKENSNIFPKTIVNANNKIVTKQINWQTGEFKNIKGDSSCEYKYHKYLKKNKYNK